MALMYIDGPLQIDDMDDRVKLVDMLDGASDGACLAVLNRLDALPVPIKDIIKLVAKKLARVRKHETRAVADAASALIAKWCAHYNSTAPPVSPRAQKPPEVVDLTKEKEKPMPRWKQAQPRTAPVPKPPLQREASVTFEDDEILRKAARHLRGGLTRVSKVAQAPSAEPARQEASLQKHDREALLDIITKVAKGVPIHTLVRASEALKNTPSLSNDVRSGCWRAACLELSQRTKRSGLDSPKFFDSLLQLLEACLRHGTIEEDKTAEDCLEHFSTSTSSDTRKKKAEELLITYRGGFDPFVGTECVVEGSECIVTKAKGNERYEVKFAGARKFTDGGRWCGTYKRSELQVVDRPKISDDKEEEFDVHKEVEAAPKAPKRPRVAEPPVAEPAEPEIGGLGTRTTKETEEKLCNDVLWSVDDADQEDGQLHPRNNLPPVPPGHKRVFWRKATVTVPGQEPFVLDRTGVDDIDGCVMPRVRIAADDAATVFDEYVVAVHDMYYDEPLNDPDADVELMLVFAYMYTHRMLLLRDCPLPRSALEKLSFDVNRELVECVVLQHPTSVELVRGSVRVGWVDDASADYFRWRDLDGDRIVKARSPAMEAAERARKFMS
ncbi:unnamed protein product [Pelagomonas calceolata]|uniref:TFIIS N-terminal domain-containing protein n=1 Tax=Pelagomonas calceolata TaxID=35677 RepID=A0A7S3ZKK2_9STRA|nr:unnamed protein product [Pelagomonas calceolata]|mmetsp:Transcript_19587/g.58239  ORF Transcript_19587/g.58239 Transcript_19587/m.58239 type:complete len:611 (+) Transcript_19587:258-2090(+)